MPFYPMRCSFQRCEAEFDYFTKPDLYEISKKSGFRDVRCTRCGSFGSSSRFYPSDSAPQNLTVKGTWGKHASPELKGRDFYTKQERDRQLAAINRVAVQDDEGLHPRKNHAAKTYSSDGTEVVKSKRSKKNRPTVFDSKAIRPAKKKAKKAKEKKEQENSMDPGRRVRGALGRRRQQVEIITHPGIAPLCLDDSGETSEGAAVVETAGGACGIETAQAQHFFGQGDGEGADVLGAAAAEGFGKVTHELPGILLRALVSRDPFA